MTGELKTRAMLLEAECLIDEASSLIQKRESEIADLKRMREGLKNRAAELRERVEIDWILF